ncbi:MULTISPECIES: hypothetical protein [Flavobacterium]|uniref:hypothetical protein n=1 Tax=Flavobacterium TaxID=237 RepID=UPI001FCC509A|nr:MULTISPECIES: hypothetical protein [Flavobacterium]UOK43656.1 hypothetical protein LZF87_05935 [Flavobacterium enshiense]
MHTIEIEEPAILFRINKALKSSLTDYELYEYTRGRWKLNPIRAKKAKYGIAVFKGVVKEVYEIEDWHHAGSTESLRNLDTRSELNSKESFVGRFEFTGKLASKSIREKYNNKSVKHYFNQGNSNPINYVNI